MLWRVAYVRVQFREQTSQKFWRSARRGAINQPDKPRFFVFFILGVDCFNYSIGKNN
jgi:hypothetical protein